MREFWFIRHGESETNAGLPSASDQSTPLTDKGRRQAEFVSRAIHKPPDMFVTSPYLRAKQTASPTLQKFPGIPVENWEIQEFSYLSKAQYADTTSRDRRKLSVDYFLKGDPELILGDGGESFSQFINRVNACFSRLQKSDHQRIILFGHGWFIRAGLWVMLQASANSDNRSKLMGKIREDLKTSPLFLNLYRLARDKKTMRAFLLLSAGVQTPNCSIIKYRFDIKTNSIVLAGFDDSHLPEDHRKTTLRNR